jgi:nucleoside-diphosphate-sugar epimerase
MAEMLLAQYAAHFDVAVLRLFAPYGPGQVDRLIPRLIDSVTEGRPVVLSRGGEPRINPIHVDDLVPLLVGAMEDDRRYTVNVAGSRAVSIRELAELIGAIVGREPVFSERDGDVAGDFVADTTLLHRLFDVTERVPLERGLETMIGVAAARVQ